MELDLGDRFKVLDKIGQGSFGDIYKVIDELKNQLGAVKLEKKDKKQATGMLVKEAKILSELANKDFFPRLIEINAREDFTFLVMSFLGPNLESLKRKRQGALTPKTVVMMGI